MVEQIVQHLNLALTRVAALDPPDLLQRLVLEALRQRFGYWSGSFALDPL
jgi:hypothetical protein